eukprot:NODE_241_length_13209_cov_0.424256.p9 type:complete len:120 gc:universal NODE_241_length_13209_cov_0.424256:8409-8768(+)
MKEMSQKRGISHLECHVFVACDLGKFRCHLFLVLGFKLMKKQNKSSLYRVCEESYWFSSAALSAVLTAIGIASTFLVISVIAIHVCSRCPAKEVHVHIISMFYRIPSFTVYFKIFTMIF